MRNHFDVLVLGSRVAAGMTASYLKQAFPDMRIATLGPSEVKLPLVGESTVEGTVTFLNELGLHDYLESEQHPKYGLTFYYAMTGAEFPPSTYSVQESQQLVRTLSRQLNRAEVDRALRRRALDLGVEHYWGKASSVELSAGALDHTVMAALEDMDGRSVRETFKARWLVDCTGRAQLLARKLDLVERPKEQRSTFWFRLRDFDKSLWLQGANILKPEQELFDSYACTHHFMGKGNWVWGIPLKSEEHGDLISIGVTWRPDVAELDVRTLDDFLAFCDREHPCLSAFVRSGVAEEISTYKNYMYRTKQVYSADRWAIVGDSAASPDPLYSTGLMFTSLQVRQLRAMIARDLEGQLRPSFVEDLDVVLRGQFAGIQGRITRQYEIMHDPFQAHLAMHLDTNSYMHFFLPLLAAGAFWNPEALPWLRELPVITELQTELDRTFLLLADASRRIGQARLSDIHFVHDWNINYRFSLEDCDPAELMSRGLLFQTKVRLMLLRRAGLRGLRRMLPELGKDLLGAVMIPRARSKALPGLEGFAEAAHRPLRATRGSFVAQPDRMRPAAFETVA